MICTSHYLTANRNEPRSTIKFSTQEREMSGLHNLCSLFCFYLRNLVYHFLLFYKKIARPVNDRWEREAMFISVHCSQSGLVLQEASAATICLREKCRNCPPIPHCLSGRPLSRMKWLSLPAAQHIFIPPQK